MEYYYRRLPIKSIMNIRELGGYAAEGGITRYGVFVRSAVPTSVSEEDKIFLKNYGVVRDLDFRGDIDPVVDDELENEDWIKYIRVPLHDDTSIRYGAGNLADGETEFTFAGHYIYMAETGKEWVKSVFETLAEEEGCTLIHCTTGKDRTGLITALLFGICGVAYEDIIADYSISGQYLKNFSNEVRSKIPTAGEQVIDDGFFKTHPENMEGILAHFDKKYGGIRGYLEDCKVEAPVVETLRNRLLLKIC